MIEKFIVNVWILKKNNKKVIFIFNYFLGNWKVWERERVYWSWYLDFVVIERLVWVCFVGLLVIV